MKSTLIALLFFFFTLTSHSQSAITPEQRLQANNYFVANDWSNTIKVYQLIIKAEPQNWNAKMRVGIAFINMRKAKEGLPYLEEAVKIANNAPTMYYLGSAYAQLDEKEKAFEWLEKSLQAGLSMQPTFEADANYTTLKGDTRYNKFYERLKRNAHPCQYVDEARQFDFWIGEWNALSAAGQPAGKSKIEPLLDDCVILENWVSNPPNLYSGKSFNLYNGVTKKWMQTWVDDKGGVTEYINGEYKDNKMIFVTLPDASHQVTRLTFHNLNPNLVRQHFEVTNDEGKTWTTTTDLYYHRIK
jgi:tetratricopeptide (TPR) repeat protein